MGKGTKAIPPELFEQYDPADNDGIPLSAYSGGSHKKVWWFHKCACGCIHKWQAIINDRVNGSNCPTCAERGNYQPDFHKTFGYIHLLDLWLEWNYELNFGIIDPFEISFGASKNAHWTCPKCKNNYEASVSNRHYNESACPYCCGLKVTRDKSLGALFPELMKEWDYENNPGIDPFTITPYSHIPINWKCQEKGHPWPAKPHDRNGRGRGCPTCKNKTQALVFEYLTQLFPDEKIIAEYKPEWIKNPKTGKYMRFDFYIEKYKIIIEIDGRQHFEQVSIWPGAEGRFQSDIYKQRLTIQKGITIIRIYQPDIWENKFLWKDYLKEIVREYKIARMIYKSTIETIYDKHITAHNNPDFKIDIEHIDDPEEIDEEKIIDEIKIKPAIDFSKLILKRPEYTPNPLLAKLLNKNK